MCWTSTQTFHVGLKAFIADGEKLLILQDDEGAWELPGGRTEKTEIQKDLHDILRREVTEELGGEVTYEIGPIFHAWIRKPEHIKREVDEVYRNDDFCIFLVGFFCKYTEGKIVLSPEHTDFRWITKDEVNSLQFENTYKNAIQIYFQRFEINMPR